MGVSGAFDKGPQIGRVRAGLTTDFTDYTDSCGGVKVFTTEDAGNTEGKGKGFYNDGSEGNEGGSSGGASVLTSRVRSSKIQVFKPGRLDGVSPPPPRALLSLL